MHQEDTSYNYFEEEAVIETELDISFKKGQDYFFGLIDKIVTVIEKMEQPNLPTSPD